MLTKFGSSYQIYGNEETFQNDEPDTEETVQLKQLINLAI